MLNHIHILLSLFIVGLAQPPSKPLPSCAALPRSHWAYRACDSLVAARLAGYPGCAYSRPRPGFLLTRYEFAVMTGRALRTLEDPHTAFAIPLSRRRALNTTVRKLAIEFAPEMKECGF